MGQVGVSVAMHPEGVQISFSTPEKGLEYRIDYDHAGYVDAVRAFLSVLIPHPGLMALVLGFGGEDGSG